MNKDTEQAFSLSLSRRTLLNTYIYQDVQRCLRAIKESLDSHIHASKFSQV